VIEVFLIGLTGRKTTITTSIKITPASPTKHRSASPASVTPAHGYTQQKSRLSRQVHPPVEEDEDDMDVDGEGDEDEGEVEDDNDETLYCFCRKQSYGDVCFFFLV
jgi:chromatin modification-related protein YNG2